MEKHIKIKTKDSHIIYGVLNTAPKKSNTLLVMVHGLTGDMTDHIFHNGARFFTSKGVDTFRFNLYDGRKDGRSLTHTSVRTHAEDLNTVLKKFRGSYKHIAVVGHSLGGPSVVMANTTLMDSIILWDPTSMPSLEDVSEGMRAPLKKIKEGYLVEWNIAFILGKEMAGEYKHLNPVSHMQNVEVPVKIICAEKFGNAKAGKEYFKHANNPKAYTVIKGATHCFDEWGVEEILFKETLAWIKK